MSRISNEEVRRRAGVEPLREQALRQQLLLFGVLAMKPRDDPVRRSIFMDQRLVPRPCAAKRKRGRPRVSWAAQIHKAAVAKAGSQQFERILLAADQKAAAAKWKRLLST